MMLTNLVLLSKQSEKDKKIKLALDYVGILVYLKNDNHFH